MSAGKPIVATHDGARMLSWMAKLAFLCPAPTFEMAEQFLFAQQRRAVRDGALLSSVPGISPRKGWPGKSSLCIRNWRPYRQFIINSLLIQTEFQPNSIRIQSICLKIRLPDHLCVLDASSEVSSWHKPGHERAAVEAPRPRRGKCDTEQKAEVHR
jgi:hypothetical protein